MTGDINMTGNSVVKFYDPIAARARAKNLTDQMVKGSVYNDADAMVVKSETGPVALKGTDVSLSNGEGGEIAISGVTEIRRKKNDPNSGAVKLNDDLINLAADTVLVGQNGSMQGEISAGTINLYDGSGAAVLKRHNSHLDINVPDAQGSVYINRNQTEGGTGELHLTEIHAPNELRLNPGTNVNVLSKRITGLSNGTANADAVNLSQLNGVKTIAQNAQTAANNASSKADQALEKAESVGYNSYPCTATETDDTLTIKGKVISHSTGEEVEVTVDINNYLKSQSNFIKAWVSNGIIYILGTLQLSGNISVHLSNLRGKNFVYPEITLYGLSGTSVSHHVATVESSLIEWEFKNGNVLQYVTVISGQDMTPLLV